MDSPSISSLTLLPKKAPLQGYISNSPDGLFLKQKKQCADTFPVNENRHLISSDKDKIIKIKQEENPCSSEESYEAGGKEVANTAPTGSIRNSEMPSTSATRFVTKGKALYIKITCSFFYTLACLCHIVDSDYFNLYINISVYFIHSVASTLMLTVGIFVLA